MKLSNYSASPDLLAERVILITGAAAGIGRAVAKSFASHGATLILLDKHMAGLETLYDEIKLAGHPEAALCPLDLSLATADDYQILEDTLKENFDRLDGLLHNAAILGKLSPLSLYDLQQWQQVMTVNLHAPLMITRACLPLLKVADSASLVFTSDSVGRQAKAYWGAYGISKFALEGMMQTLAEELDANTSIRVNSLDPGPLRSALRSAAYPAEDNHHLVDVESIIDRYLYLFGDDSRELNGQSLSAQ